MWVQSVQRGGVRAFGHHNVYALTLTLSLLLSGGTFPSLFDKPEIIKEAGWAPQAHVHCSEAVLSVEGIDDDVPKFPGRAPSPGNNTGAQ